LKGLKVQAKVLTETVEDLRKRCGNIAVITSFKYVSISLRPLRASLNRRIWPKFWRTSVQSFGYFPTRVI
jgi:hypothetical protein